MSTSLHGPRFLLLTDTSLPLIDDQLDRGDENPVNASLVKYLEVMIATVWRWVLVKISDLIPLLPPPAGRADVGEQEPARRAVSHLLPACPRPRALAANYE